MRPANNLADLKIAAEKLLPRLDNNAIVAGDPEKRSLSYQSAALIRALLLLKHADD